MKEKFNDIVFNASVDKTVVKFKQNRVLAYNIGYCPIKNESICKAHNLIYEIQSSLEKVKMSKRICWQSFLCHDVLENHQNTKTMWKIT